MNVVTREHEPEVTLALALEHGLTKEEYERILGVLSRTPTYTELGIYSVMWSEHCSYKNSIAVLKTLPRTGGRLLMEAGEENAGLVDIGDGLAVVFKIESHNHPSAVEPYQGAATGVGGILRDIFTMGARPIAALNSLRFGELSDDRVKYLFKNVVKGIGDYGNSFGVPTVGGEIYFDQCYKDNPLVNAMAVGIVNHGGVARAVAHGVGNPVMIVGSATGRDGIHGATFASEEISEKSESKRPSVQVGDPFTEKLLLEATLEAIQTGFVVGVQDMGAAGLTCSSTEMSAKGRSGMTLHIERVPAREENMSAYEVMLSESQERMLLVVEKGHEAEVQKIFEKWDLPSSVIGEVKGDGMVSVYKEGVLKAEVPAESLVLGGGAPVYTRETRVPGYIESARSFDLKNVPVPSDLNEVLLKLLGSTLIASKRWVFEQYDSMVRTNSMAISGGDAAIMRIKGTRKALALTSDCNARYVYLNPRRGGEIAVAEAARNVVCAGAYPIAITNCLNFGNPYDQEVYWQFTEAVAGIGEACRKLGTPVTGGNVSFYNESPEQAVFPTPVIGMLGLIEDVGRAIGPVFREPGDMIVLLGRPKGEIGGSEYLYQLTGVIAGDAPTLDLDYEERLHRVALELMVGGRIKSAHDSSEGGLAVALMECCFGPEDTGAEVSILSDSLRPDFVLFGESQSMMVLSVGPDDVEQTIETAQSRGVDAAVIGRTTGNGTLKIDELIEMNVARGRESYEGSISAALRGTRKDL